MADAEIIAGEARLHRAVRALAAQSGTPAEQIVDWLCDGGLAQMALSHFAQGQHGEREQMTDKWLEDAFKRALFLANCQPEDPAANVLRGFANRVLQQFGDREGMRDALNVAYTRHKDEQAAPGVKGLDRG